MTLPAARPGRAPLARPGPDIWIDGSFLETRWTGIAYYGAHLLRALAQCETAHDMAVLGAARTRSLSDVADAIARRGEAERQAEGAKGGAEPDFGLLLSRWPQVKTLIRQTRFAALTGVWRKRRGIFHALNFVPPMQVQMPVIPVIHDVSCLTHPESHPPERVRYFHQRLGVLTAAPVIHTVSRFSAGEIERVLGISSSRMHVISPGPDPEAMALRLDQPLADDAARLLRRHGLTADGYVLGVGTLEPRKNLRFLIEAYLRLPQSVQDQGPLVLVGTSGWDDRHWPSGHDRAVAAGRIRHVRYLTRAELLTLYRHARLSAYPSIYEGYGLPVIESLCLGTPVLVCSGTACDEAGGGHATALEAGSVEAWTAALAEALSEPLTLEERLRRREHMAARPSWFDAARTVLGLYDIVVRDAL